MLPVDLQADHFGKYPPLAANVARAHLAVLRQLPLSFLPSLLRELIEYDYKFPAERAGLDGELATLSALRPEQLSEWFRGFAKLRLTPAQEHLGWVNQPTAFTEQLSAYLWSTQQMDAFRLAATTYGDRLRSSTPAAPLSLSRLGVVIIGQGVASYARPLFRKLRKEGTYFSSVHPENGLSQILQAAADRAQAHPVPFAHWYIDGGVPHEHSSLLTSISYQALAPTREALLKNIEHEVTKPGLGPEELRNYLTLLSPLELGLHGDPVLDRFQVKLLTEGSGTQIFSTTFAQWAGREVLRRAEALTLVVRFAPRQRQRPMNELLASSPTPLELDPLGSLIDGDMAAYYHWINQQRLPSSQRSSFVVWFEDQNQALAIGPSLPRGAESNSGLNLASLLTLTTS